MSNFLVIDTEGKDEIAEIAILDSQGELIYEAYNAEHPSKQDIKIKRKPLETILSDFIELARNKRLVFHYAEHDCQVIEESFQKLGQPCPNFETDCTWELAQTYFPRLDSYSLEHLSKQLLLRVDGQLFNSEFAHAARYDAQFTYQLYQEILKRQNPLLALKNEPNPFNDSRVDNPFQTHPDYTKLYEQEFTTLKSLVQDIKQDFNHQSKGAVVIGEAGSGKTHLMMRLAQDVLSTNRLLFIRQPNHPDAVLFHTYSRILESFVEPVPNTNYTQLDYLLAQGFINFLHSEYSRLSSKGKALLDQLQDSHLSLFEILNRGSKQENWQRMERWLTNWWKDTYSGAGYAIQIIKGIVKYCRYTDPHRKQLITRWLAGGELEDKEADQLGLEKWSDDLNKEDFALEAMSVFGKFSLLDEPLIIVFDQLEGLGLPHHHKTLLSFGEAVKELFTHVPNSLIILNLFSDRWQQFQDALNPAVTDRIAQDEIHLEKPNKQNLKAILQLKISDLNISLDKLFTDEEQEDILSQDSIRAVINRASGYYKHKVHGTPLPTTSESLNQPQTNTDYRLQKLEEEVASIKRQLQQVFSTKESIASEEPKKEPIPAEEPNPKNSSSNPDETPPSNSVQEEILDYLKQQEQAINQQYQKPTIINDHDDIGKIIEIAQGFQYLTSLEMQTLKLGKKKLPDHVVVKKGKSGNVLGFLQIAGSAFTARLKNFNQLVVSHPNLNFTLMRDAREPKITGKVGRQEIEKLNHTDNGSFTILQQADRVELELLYKLITDINNQEFDVKLETALETFLEQRPHHWLTESLLIN
ncbi:MAG: exonuclease [Cyanobacteria bacterium SW_9_44_58]|nr:MAG: exonuclease [Cyanobacteria bacterium SW_9_44_58]